MKLFASSQYRYRATASERRLYGGNIVTEYLVGEEGSNASTWLTIRGYGVTQHDRKRYALDVFMRRTQA